MPARWRYRGAAAVLVLLACGCAGESPDRGTTVLEPPCRPDHRAPITERELKAALDAEGIRLLRDSDCSGEELALSNITDTVSSEQVDVILVSEGHVFCDLYVKDTFSPRIERFVWRNDPDPTYLDVLNVSCAIYPETREQTDALERALRRLPGVSDLPSIVPSEDAVRD